MRNENIFFTKGKISSKDFRTTDKNTISDYDKCFIRTEKRKFRGFTNVKDFERQITSGH